ncbi:tyrosine-type recombinase/integrase [Gordonia sp. FQ]|uniref:tyrosine-type recombinase/integrase n=1 Tax=Gordonia sp. FQ TaxID=3446634 RepID=UPI003F85965F
MLRPRDIDLDRCRIQIARSVATVDGKSVIGAPKTWERRVVAMPATVRDLLIPIIDAAPSPDALLWPRPRAGDFMRPPSSCHWFSQAVSRLVDRTTPLDADGAPAGPSSFPRVTAHELRHTAASLMIASGAHVKTVQRQLGHKSATMTPDQYGHLFEDDLDVIADRMGKAMAAAECGRNVGTTGLATANPA